MDYICFHRKFLISVFYMVHFGLYSSYARLYILKNPFIISFRRINTFFTKIQKGIVQKTRSRIEWPIRTKNVQTIFTDKEHKLFILLKGHKVILKKATKYSTKLDKNTL